jgi:hypothetical protein
MVNQQEKIGKRGWRSGMKEPDESPKPRAHRSDAPWKSALRLSESSEAGGGRH